LAPSAVAPSVKRIAALSEDEAKMLKGDEQGALAKWREMNDEELDTEINSYR
jgi:hypothetical protein